MTRTFAIVSLATFLGTLGPASAATWSILEEQEISINYGDSPTEPLISVTCSPRQSEIFVPAARGTKPPAEVPVLTVKEGDTTNSIKLKAFVCGQPSACQDLPDGDVPTYETSGKGKAMALRFADKATAVEIDAPGAKVSAPADRAVFKKFAAACRKW